MSGKYINLYPGDAGGVLGVGADIVEIGRIRALLERYGEKFARRVFTEAERNYCESRRDGASCYAARFAAKEAVLKAMGTGLAGCCWTDVEVVRNAAGRPAAALHGGASILAGQRQVGRVLISLSHDRAHAMAFAVALGRGSGENAGCNV
ncbi:MAG: holo-ACP synthase [Eubacteriales bacterium]